MEHNLSSSKFTTTRKNMVGTLLVSIFVLQPLLFGDTAYALTAPNATSQTSNPATGAPTQTTQLSGKATQMLNRVTGTAANTAARSAVSSVAGSITASSGIAGKCFSQVMQQQVEAYAAGAAIAAIGVAGKAFSAGIGVPSSDFGSGVGSIMQSAEGGATTVMSWIKPMTDCLVHEASMLMVDELKAAVTNAIRDGLGGSPNYSTNTNRLLSDLSNIVSQQLGNQIAGLELCDFTGTDSFRQNLSKNIMNSNNQTRNGNQSFAQKIKCPFSISPTTGNTSQAFYNDFHKGGWGSFEKSLSDSGNPFGTSLITSQELAARQEETQKLAEQQLAQGNGYLPVVDTAECNYPPDLEAYLYPYENNKAKLNENVTDTELANVQRLYCKVTTPGKTVADTASKSATSAWDQLNISGALGKTMDGFASGLAADAMNGVFR